MALPVPDDPNMPVLIPNFAAAQQVAVTAQSSLKRDDMLATPLLKNLLDTDMSQEALDELITVLCKKREEILCGEKRTTNALIDMFLDQMIQRKETEMLSLERQLDAMRADKSALLRIRTISEVGRGSLTSSALVPDGSSVPISPAVASASLIPVPSLSRSKHGDVTSDVMKRLTSRITKHYDGLQTVYAEISARSKRNQVHVKEEIPDSDDLESTRPCASSERNTHSHCETEASDERLGSFGEVIRGVAQYGHVEKFASLNYDIEPSPQMSIVSSLEFDKDGEMFVVAGVTKRIKVFNYESVVNNPTAVHYPLGQLKCRSKISNISWNPYQKQMLCSSDYDGNVTVWDTGTSQIVKTFQEHEKRCWTVHFNSVDPHLIASGSDDSKVKLWSLNCDRSVNTIDAKVNVCCVYFSPSSRHHVVFGSADHCVHLYDIRNTARALNVFKGHRKAVSYVRYINEDQVVSASTDSSLRVWCARTGKCLRVLRGHTNEKNFVGLSGTGDHIVCGSENSRAYFYYKAISEPVVSQYVGRDIGPDEEPDGFVSSVCWKKNSDVALVANSNGRVQFFKLT